MMRIAVGALVAAVAGVAVAVGSTSSPNVAESCTHAQCDEAWEQPPSDSIDEANLLQLRSEGPAAKAACKGKSCLALNTHVGANKSTAFLNQKGCLSFIHIPKTGGGSIEEESRIQRDRLFPNPKKLELRLWGDADHRLTCKRMVQRRCYMDNDGANCAIQHKPPSLDDTLLASYQPCETFCVVRNPLDRLISDFKYNHQTEHDCSDEMFNNFAVTTLQAMRDGKPYVGHCHYFPQYTYIFDRQNRRICDHILNFTNLDDDFEKLMRSRGSDAKLKHQHVHLMPNADCVINASSAVKALVAEVYEIDFETFGFSLPV
mmetsp:Transcript_43116/g.92315  ORF Transcript_43116/g.92315 Transcript_43116/m.92315 type:complete len:317 (-) Transcript_43116:106-1056(-)|eukprot:CAMPEP_0206422906 /NCGR_PEP_ID=MMETSP0324_2-20121206/2372_1 /ASSEMBLY_ACC=CAM_ASM_000836 /TAXON_ID=2866 /ORGANISM="Crypthecodinium cohnii, Strain Seligo" /LENGTH=316 /DNA_ID=CAMNT_0053887381 /DNA_START=80 /DNA_END=1030 /DNA_ORIENTATION=+